MSLSKFKKRKYRYSKDPNEFSLTALDGDLIARFDIAGIRLELTEEMQAVASFTFLEEKVLEPKKLIDKLPFCISLPSLASFVEIEKYRGRMLDPRSKKTLQNCKGEIIEEYKKRIESKDKNAIDIEKLKSENNKVQCRLTIAGAVHFLKIAEEAGVNQDKLISAKRLLGGLGSIMDQHKNMYEALTKPSKQVSIDSVKGNYQANIGPRDGRVIFKPCGRTANMIERSKYYEKQFPLFEFTDAFSNPDYYRTMEALVLDKLEQRGCSIVRLSESAEGEMFQVCNNFTQHLYEDIYNECKRIVTRIRDERPQESSTESSESKEKEASMNEDIVYELHSRLDNMIISKHDSMDDMRQLINRISGGLAAGKVPKQRVIDIIDNYDRPHFVEREKNDEKFTLSIQTICRVYLK